MTPTDNLYISFHSKLTDTLYRCVGGHCVFTVFYIVLVFVFLLLSFSGILRTLTPLSALACSQVCCQKDMCTCFTLTTTTAKAKMKLINFLSLLCACSYFSLLCCVFLWKKNVRRRQRAGAFTWLSRHAHIFFQIFGTEIKVFLSAYGYFLQKYSFTFTYVGNFLNNYFFY